MKLTLRLIVAILAIGTCAVTALHGVPEANAGTAGSSCAELVTNGDFEDGTYGWSSWSALGYNLVSDFNPHGGMLGAYLGGDDNAQDVLSQTIPLPEGMTSLVLNLWWSITTEETAGSFDRMSVTLQDGGGTGVAVLLAVDNTAPVNVWDLSTSDLSAFAGRDLKLTIAVTTDANHPTAFFVDDVSVAACPGDATPTPTQTPTDTQTPAATVTSTPTRTPTVTVAPSGTSTATPTATSTPTATGSPGSTPGASTATASPTSAATDDPADVAVGANYLPCMLR